jgi:hypothetical protein
MKLALILLACVGLAASSSFYKTQEVRVADKNFLERQKFLFEIVYRIEDPLFFEEWIKFGDKFIVDKSFYTQYDIYMEKFYEAYKMGALLPKGEFFGALVKTHMKQAWGLFNFFYYAKDFETFQRNVCWARMHVNEGMFVYALTLAVIHRDDFQGLILPSINEIFPQFFFNSRFVYEAEKFDYDMWSKYIMYEKEYNDIYYYGRNFQYDKYAHDGYFYMKDFKTYQWYKLMGLENRFYSENNYLLRENIYEFNQDSRWLSLFNDTQFFYMPVDYTRDIDYFNRESELSYFTEDVGFNSYWYYLNLDYSFFLDGKTFGLNKDRRGEYWIYNVQQLLARYYMERLSHGFGEIPEFSYFGQIEYGYDPQLTYYNGVGYSYRKNYYEIQSYQNFDMHNNIYNTFQRIYDVIELGYYTTVDGTIVDLRTPESIEFIGNMLQGNIDTYDRFFLSYWYVLSHMYFADVDYNDVEVYPNVMLNFETMMRDPMFYVFYKKIADVFYRFKYNLQPYTHEELFFPGVEIKDVHVDELVTYFDLVDFDVTNLLNDKMVFHDGQFVWDKTLLARQMRLNHKPFNFEFFVESDKAQRVVIRTFLGPKYDETGRLLSLSENRENFMELDEFVYDVTAGKNTIKRSSNDFYWTVKDRTTYTELYKYVMLAYEGKYDFPLDISEPHCGFPDRLILPRGWSKGMPMQFFFMVTPYTSNYEQFSTYDYTYSCGIGSGVRHIDNLPFGYPFDRVIDEYDFFVPNMYFRDAKIYHYDTFGTYYQNQYKNFGKFDYTFYNNYYTKYFKH